MKKQKLIALAIFVVALIIAIMMVRLSRKPLEQSQKNKSVQIRTVTLTSQPETALIKSTAVIEANQSLTLTPEIPGRIIWISSKAENGGRIAKGEVLVKLDDRDLKFALEQKKVAVESARLEVDRETVRAELAANEWKRLGESENPNDLVLRVRQQEVARLNLASAQSALEKAQLDLSRTNITAPFSAIITRKAAAVGQVVSTQSQLFDLIEAGELRADVSIGTADLAYIDIPGIDGVKTGSAVTVRQRIDQTRVIEVTGEIISLVGSIDRQTRRARVIVRIPQSTSNSIPLMPGAFAEIEIRGKTVANAYSIPRELIQQGQFIWEVKQDSTLNKITISKLWGTESSVIMQLESQEFLRIARSLPEASVSGMKVIPAQEIDKLEAKHEKR